MRQLHQVLLAAALAVATVPAMPCAAAGTAPLQALEASQAGIRQSVLDNGMVCLVKQDHSAPVVAVQIWIGSGAVHEGKHLGAGLSHALEHMVFKGTPTRPVGAITREINDAGGQINAYTALDRTVFHAEMPGPRWLVGLNVLADAAMNASFPEDEWDREKEVILREMAMNRDNPDRELGRLMWSTAYTTHPYRHPVIGYEDVFRNITREDLAAFFRENYVPDNMTVVVVGDVRADEAEAEVRRIFASFPRRARAPVVLPAEPEQMAPRFQRRTGAYEISRLAWCYPATDIAHADTPALDVLAAIVGQGRSSRLVRQLKERQKLVYSIGAWSFTPKDPGLFGIEASFDPGKEDQVIAAIQAEIDAWASAPFSEDEVAKAKRQILVGELASLQTMDGQAYSIGSDQFYTGDPTFTRRYLEMVEAVTPADVADVAARYLAPAGRSLVVLAPGPAATPALAAPEAAHAAPPVTRSVMENGIPLIVREDHRLPFIYICAAMRGGLLSEEAGDNGISRLMSGLLTRGTTRHSAEEIAEITEALGASLTTFSGGNSFGLQGQCLAQDLDAFMELFSECLLEPVFPADELEKAREVQLAAVREQRERPMFLADESLRGLLFTGHPYQWDEYGTESSVHGLTREEVAAFFKRHAVAGNLAVCMFGDITVDQALAAARRLQAVPADPFEAGGRAAARPELPARAKRRAPKEQAVVLLGFPGVDVKDPRADALSMLQDSFSGLSSELGMQVREKRGLAYYVGAYQQLGLDPGAFVFYAGTREDAVPELESLIGEEIERVAGEGLRPDELERSREGMIGAYQMKLQDNASLAQECALNELYGLGYDHVFSYEARIRALTSESVRDAARSVLGKDRAAVSLVLPEPAATTQEETQP